MTCFLRVLWSFTSSVFCNFSTPEENYCFCWIPSYVGVWGNDVAVIKGEGGGACMALPSLYLYGSNLKIITRVKFFWTTGCYMHFTLSTWPFEEVSRAFNKLQIPLKFSNSLLKTSYLGCDSQAASVMLWLMCCGWTKNTVHHLKTIYQTNLV